MNVDTEEIRKFEVLADRWWDADGDFKPLHDINPLRLEYLRSKTDITAGMVLDVGCGGGILSESMALRGATVTGIDMAESPLAVARLHAMDAGVEVEYLATTAEALASERPGRFSTVTCLEVLEHVPDYASTIGACADLMCPGGHLVLSTINRNAKAYVLAVIGAEYVLGLLPKGTHDYAKFIRPAELAAAVRAAGFEVLEIIGMRYNPFTRQCRLSSDVDVNYLLHARKT
ncbi:MAG: bifunctional 2-polyprenyl-6-hydroxyphenol methylase/3-demethylubiquinol 3-O-methyltransferase UbiG [Gammaproteobacteria bacterium]|nr:bifunctional 2-polyprenyl-6-hydroxyphenol methylase/3-demethylubiquinol 3-O-methyltransferase UbiG [Gammaproteobacteria bacterium]